MKVVIHQRVPPTTEIDLHYNPLTVFVTPNVELTINKGDRLIDVVKAIQPHMKWFDRKTIKQIVAFYFTMGERAAANRFPQRWKAREFKAKNDRQYLVDFRKKVKK